MNFLNAICHANNGKQIRRKTFIIANETLSILQDTIKNIEETQTNPNNIGYYQLLQRQLENLKTL